MKTSHKIGVGAAAGIISVGSLLGVALAQADPTDSPSSSSSAAAQDSSEMSAGMGGRHHGRVGMNPQASAAALAEKLGLDETSVADAMQAAREATRPERPAEATEPTETDRSAQQAAFVKELASQLGVEEADVTQALDELRAAADAERQASFQTRLDAAVTDGTLTQSEADAVMKAAKAGIIGFGGGRH